MADNFSQKDPEVFEFIDKMFAKEKEDYLVKKLKDSVCFEMESRLRRITKEIGRSQESIPYERLVSHLESHILYLEDELRKKDCLFEKLIDNNLNTNSSKTQSVCISCEKAQIKSSKNDIQNSKSQSNNSGTNKKDINDESCNKNSLSVPNGLIDFEFADSSSKISSVDNDVKEKDKKEESRSVKRRRVIICGDSMVNGIDGDGVSSKSFSTAVKHFGGSTSLDMVDYIKPSANSKPDKIIVHVGTNDITKNVTNTTENLDLIVNAVKDLSPETQLYFSEICMRKDIPSSFQKVSEINRSLKQFCQSRNIGFVENANIDASCLARKKLHLNQKGIGRLAINFKSFLEKH